ncbi:hypothetical protein FNF31_04782 [Cafeteria roenbergensis]|uniref:DUF445 domain-containing protein n=1 Tax=Cafeteria roenbergensis TaxID=33653 RepID=A0A5A8D2A8_CAFRO|nr:hypothetical protein FNF31_04782 [Cafeteria roenbergensis]KAA0159748.1 hypothetical protein FNF28_05711 [Cafeteria roenbergensis]
MSGLPPPLAAASVVPPFENEVAIVLTALIPIIAAVVGYGTNVLAIQMTFWPLEYWGLKPCGVELPGICGWQGIVPQRAEAMAVKAVRLLTAELITVEEVFERLDPAEFAADARASLWNVSSRITSRLIAKTLGTTVRDAIPIDARREIVATVMETSERMTIELLTVLKANIKRVFDLEATVVRVFTREPELLVLTFKQCGDAEFRFLERSGAYFGLLFGLVQMAVWVFYREWWILPVFGGVVGWATNYVALKLIFQPVNPIESCCGLRHCCGRPVTRCCCGRPMQGLFLQRQKEVSEVFASIVSNKVVRAKHIVEDLQEGDGGKVLEGLARACVEHEFEAMLSGVLGTATSLALGPRAIEECRDLVAREVYDGLPAMMLENEDIMRRAFDIEPTVRERLQALPPDKFEQVLHPVFEEDEWKLIAVGAVIGLIVGFAQAGLSILTDMAAAGTL